MHTQRAATAACFLLLLGATGSISGNAVVAAFDARNAALPNYTFHADVAMAMHHFPWLHFHMSGDGIYAKGDKYSIHFTQMPFFASKIHDIDLSLIDPVLWPKNFLFTEAGMQGDDAIFDLQALHDPTLVHAQVAITAGGADWVDSTYTDGTHIHMAVTHAATNGFMLPSKIDASIDYPHMPLSAKADLNNYQFAGLGET